MAWRAYIENVLDNASPAENIWVEVLFRDPASAPVREFRKSYKYVAGMGAVEFTALVLEDRQKLRNLDAAKSALEAALGTEVT